MKKGRTTHAVGYELDANLIPKRTFIDVTKPGDYGADPVEGGMFRMVPSGDIVDAAEKEKRLGRKGGRVMGSAGLRSGGRRADVWLSSVDGWYHWTVKNQKGTCEAYGKERSEADARSVASKAMTL
jgi:hypothetical protein